MSNIIDFTKNGGYRFKQFTLRKMQEAYFQILKAFIAFCNVPDVGNFIIAGMKIEGANITAGYAYIDGELCRFEPTAGTAATKIKKNVVVQSLGFQNGNNENVFRFVNAQVDAVDGAALSTFTRVSPVFDANYVHTDTNYTQVEKTKLSEIEEGAEKNVQTQWGETNPLSDAFLVGKPDIIEPLYRNTFYGISDIDGTAIYPVPFSAPVTTSDYMVLGSFKANVGTSPNSHNNLIWSVRNKTVNGFDLLIREATGSSQNVSFDYIVLPLN